MVSKMNLAIALVVSAVHAAPIQTAPTPTPPLPTQSNFDGAAWEGFWYELYSLPQADETMCTCTASNFTELTSPGEWQDLNFCKRFGKMESVPLKMYELDRHYPERLAIGMAPWMTFTKMWVIKTDYKTYSLIGDPSRKALWIYGREAGIDRPTYANLTAAASDLGFDVSKLKMTDHNDNCQYSTASSVVTAPAPAPVQRYMIQGNQCNDLLVDFTKESSLDQVKEWWAGNAWKYPATVWKTGLCPKPFTHVEHSEHPIGVSGVTYRDLGEVTALEAQADPTPMDCSFGDNSTQQIVLHRDPSASGNIKIRTCRTGIGCTGDKGKWNSFKDCEYEIGPNMDVKLTFEQKVAYFVFYNTKNDLAPEFWKPKNAPWPASYTLTD